MQANWTLGKITVGVRWSRAAATAVTSVIGVGIEIRSAVMDRGDL